MSPTADQLPPPIPSMHRQATDYAYLTSGALPHHLRTDLPQASPRSSPTGSTSSLSSNVMGHRRTANTSHPAPYGHLPSTMEPHPHGDRQMTVQNGNAHMNTVGWHSQATGMSPGHQDPYVYPDPYASVGHMYYPSSIRRPQSTEPPPDPYDTKRMGEQVWTTQVS